MAEVDYQLALLLQHKFDQEKKLASDLRLAKSLQEQYENEVSLQEKSQADLELAKSLQEHYQKEYEVERPCQNLVYDDKTKRRQDSTKSLTDPSWEVIDPTPDIHALFIAFDQRFFWNTLGAVTVSWSKRMTTCAGICSYQGRGGMCTITLSEPLLKLRPRKDLVETLLHEMIHAYLFVTNNNRDRDGHGPEFHKHMHRINAEAGTNITVYHDFHDEVRLYQQHWWRCDGPCQSWKPYFGMVRRAMNRPPGPSDRWWGEHSRNCGGNFVKVKEPEKTVKSSKSKPIVDSKKTPDIRSFLPITKVSDQSKPVSSNSPQNSKAPSSNIHTISNNDNTKSVSNPIPKAGNIFGFTNSRAGPKPGSTIRGAIKNTSNTIVINKKPSKTQVEVKMPDKEAGPSSCGKKGCPSSGRALSEQEYSSVRNHWLSKFPNQSSGKKRASSSSTEQPLEKVPKLLGTTVKCPACSKDIKDADLNAHLDKCLSDDNFQECIICQENIAVAEFQQHLSKCTEEAFGDDVFEDLEESVICVTCRKGVPKGHPHNCGEEGDSKEETKCEVCEKTVPAKQYPGHLEKCLNGMYNNIEAQFNSASDEMVDCLACSKKICKTQLNNHLEECLSLSQIFDDENEPVVDDKNKKSNTYNCPFCTKLFEEKDMSQHIDDCLGIANSSHISK